MFNKGVFKCAWLEFVKRNLDHLGLSNIFASQTAGCNFSWFKMAVKQRLEDMYKQNWLAEVSNNETCINYRLFKTQFGMEKYLINLPRSSALNILKLRTCNIPGISTHWQRDLSCHFCDEDHVDEYHYIMVCPHFNQERFMIKDKKYFKHANVLLFKELMSSEKHYVKLSILCKRIIIELKGYVHM